MFPIIYILFKKTIVSNFNLIKNNSVYNNILICFILIEK